MAKAKKTQIHELKDLLVEEVSIVDRPANQRPFLLVKNEDGMADKGQEVTKDKDGNLVTKPGDKPADPPTPTDKDEDLPDLGAIFKAAGDAIVEKRLSIPADMRSEIFKALGAAINRLHTVMGAVDIAEIDRGEGGSTLTPVLGAELMEVAKELQIVGKKLSAVKKADDKPGEDGFDLDAALDAFSGVLEGRVEKRGAKMSAGRLNKLKEFLAGLNKIVGELDGGDVTKSDDPPAPDTAATQAIVEKAVGALTSKVDRLVEVNKRQARELRDLKEARPPSNAIPVDKADPTPAKDETHWPMDMAKSQRVDKSIDFSDNN